VRWPGLLLAAPLWGLGCESVVGAHFDGLSSYPVACDPAAPDGGGDPTVYTSCGAGMVCDNDSDPTAFRCETSTGSGAAGASCTQSSDCAAGYGCETLADRLGDGTPVLQCSPWVQTSGGFGFPPIAGCDPTRTGSCPAGRRCSFGSSNGQDDVTFCEAPSLTALPADNPCKNDSDCEQGLACRSFGPSSSCVPYCADPPTGTCPSAGQVCTAFTTPRLSGSTTYGFCVAPPCDPMHPQTPAAGFSTTCAQGQTCELAGDNYAYCRTQGANTLPAGEPCNFDLQPAVGYVEQCMPGLVCVGSTVLGSFCRAYCRVGYTPSDCGSVECLPFGATPFTLPDGSQYGFCPPPPCDPIDPSDATAPFTPCPSGQQCRFEASTSTECVTPSGKNTPLGQTCSGVTDCTDAAQCVFFNNAATGTCLPTCRVGGSDCSVFPQYPVCHGFSDQADEVNGVQYGYCNTQ
jgi:hypothetical protein